MDKKNLVSLLRTGAEKIRSLGRSNESLGERLDLVYAMIDLANGNRRNPPRIGMEECVASKLEKAAAELEAGSEEFRVSVTLIPPAPEGSLHAIVAKFQRMAFEVEHAANQYLKAPEATRPEFLKVFFARLRALNVEATGYGLNTPPPPNV